MPPESRKTEAPSWSPLALLSHPGWPTLAVLGALVLVCAAVVLLSRRRHLRK